MPFPQEKISTIIPTPDYAASTLQLPAVEDKKKKIKRELDQQGENFEKEQRKTDHEINDMLRRMIELEALEKKVSSLAQTLFFFCLSFSFSHLPIVFSLYVSLSLFQPDFTL
jgi:hypothetical protein